MILAKLRFCYANPTHLDAHTHTHKTHTRVHIVVYGVETDTQRERETKLTKLNLTHPSHVRVQCDMSVVSLFLPLWEIWWGCNILHCSIAAQSHRATSQH